MASFVEIDRRYDELRDALWKFIREAMEAHGNEFVLHPNDSGYETWEAMEEDCTLDPMEHLPAWIACGDDDGGTREVYITRLYRKGNGLGESIYADGYDYTNSEFVEGEYTGSYMSDAKSMADFIHAVLEQEERLLPADAAESAADGHYVDLGLSVKWATCNVGADRPEEFGDHYMYDEAMELGLRLPSLDEIKELINKCDWEWTQLNGVNGYKVTGPNGNSIFLPAAGYRYSTSLDAAGSYGSYWSATPYSDSSYAYDLYFYSDYYDWGYSYRGYGQTVRPVSE